MGKTEPINDLDLADGGWRDCTFNTDSLWIIPRRDSTGVHKGDYHGNFVPQIPREFILRFTKEGGNVLDVFAGSGTTLIEAKSLGRNAVGFDISAEARAITNSRLANTKSLESRANGVKVLDRDALDSRSYRDLKEQFDLVFIHPPYLDIVEFSKDPRCLAQLVKEENSIHYKKVYFYQYMRQLMRYVEMSLKVGGHFVYVIGDVYRKGEWHTVGFDSWKEMLGGRPELLTKAVVVKNMEGNERSKGLRKNLWRYRHLKNGSFDFKHEYIFLGRKIS